jgi:redox-sensitive bicupin YhaK (pirin superfamily)
MTVGLPGPLAHPQYDLLMNEVFEPHRGRETALGPLMIWRALPVAGRRLIGPWCFLDRYGPITFEGRKPMDVPPHPHIGLQTVSWLVDGEVVHHDSLGCEGLVTPGGVNVMTAGSGIAHVEETPMRNRGRLDGVQLWVALPDAERHRDASFQHIAEVPRIEEKGGVAQLFMGTLGEVASPADSYSNMIGADLAIHRGETFALPLDSAREHGIFLLGGDAQFEHHDLSVNTLYYLGRGRSELALSSANGARVLLIGGVPFDEKIVMWWNFVARTPEEIRVAREDWAEGRRFGAVPYDGSRIEAPPLARMAPPNPAS